MRQKRVAKMRSKRSAWHKHGKHNRAAHWYYIRLGDSKRRRKPVEKWYASVRDIE